MLVVAATPATTLGIYQVVAHQDPIHRRTPRQRTTPSRRSWVRIERGPHPGLARRSATTRASTTGDICWAQEAGLQLLSARPASPDRA